MTELQKNKWYKLSERTPPFTTGEHIPLLVCAKDEWGYAYKLSSVHQTGLKGLDDNGNPIYSGFEFSGWDKHFQRSFGHPTHFMIIGSPVTDKLPPKTGDFLTRGQDDVSVLKIVRDVLEYARNKLYEKQVYETKTQEAINIIDRMIETPAPQGWSAIETAPKDGTEILLALWSGHPEHKTSFCWAINGHYKDGFFYSKDPMIGKLASPTHWQHITAPTPAPICKSCDNGMAYGVDGEYPCPKCQRGNASTDPSKFRYDRSDYVVMRPIRKNEDGSLTDAPIEKFEGLEKAIDCFSDREINDFRNKYGAWPIHVVEKAARAYLKLQSGETE